MVDLKKLAVYCKEIRTDYLPNVDRVMDDRADRVQRVEDIIRNDLDDIERTLILLYAECGTFREMERKMGVSRETLRLKVNKVREKIIKLYYGL